MPLTRNGGKPVEIDVMNYAEPTGVKRNYPAAPGLGADNYGNCGTQNGDGTSATSSGSVGLGGDALRRNGGAQGRR
jgi:hypothetical protein